MAQKKVLIDGIGEVTLQKRRGTKNLRISIGAGGDVRVGMPTWVPYSAGVAFARQKLDWILTHRQKRPQPQLLAGMRVGKYHRVVHLPSTLETTTVRVAENQILVKTNIPVENALVQKKICKAAENALNAEAAALLPGRVDEMAKQYSYTYSKVVIKKLTARWGSCSGQGVITLSYYLMQLPWPLIDYVILHELAHTKQLNHSSAFWGQLSTTHKDYKTARKQIKNYYPAIIPSDMP